MKFWSGLFIDRTETRGSTVQKPASGGHNRKLDYLREPKILCHSVHKTGVSQRKLARKLEISAGSIRKVLAKY